MKQKVILILLSLFLASLFVISCNDCGPFPNRYKLTSLDGDVYSAHYDANATDKLLLTALDSDTLDYNKYSIFINRTTEAYFTLRQEFDFKSFGLINSAYACSPIIPISDEIVDSILITSTKNFDGTHMAGTDLSDLFDIVISDLEGTVNQERHSLVDYLSTRPTVPDEMTLILNSPPLLMGDFGFTLKFYIDGIDTDYYEFDTVELVIRP